MVLQLRATLERGVVLYADGNVFVGSAEWPILVPFPFPKMSSHIYLCAVEGIRGKIEKVMRGNK